MFVCIYQAQHRDAFVQERYGQYDLSDPFLALQRDSESEERQNMLTQPHTHLQGRAVGPNPLAVLKLVMTHCKRMQERMMGQLAAAESRHKRVRGNAHSYADTLSHIQWILQLTCFRFPCRNDAATTRGPSQCQSGTHTFTNRLVVYLNVCMYLLISFRIGLGGQTDSSLRVYWSHKHSSYSFWVICVRNWQNFVMKRRFSSAGSFTLAVLCGAGTFLKRKENQRKIINSFENDVNLMHWIQQQQTRPSACHAT